MSKVEAFLSKEEETEVVEAIRLAEENTSGEIRVHIGSFSFAKNGKYPRTQWCFDICSSEK